MTTPTVRKTIAIYALLGPVIGACVVFAGIVFSGTGAAGENLLPLIGTVFLFSFPFGVPQALVAAIAYSFFARFTKRRAVVVLSSVVAGATGSIAFAALLGSLGMSFSNPASAFGLLLPPVVSAGVIAMYLSRPSQRGA